MTSEVQISKYKTSKGKDEVIVELVNDNLWLLLILQELQLAKSFKGKNTLRLDNILRKIGRDGCPRRQCQMETESFDTTDDDKTGRLDLD